MLSNYSPLGRDVKRRVSYKKKVANNFSRAKSIMELVDNYYGGRDQAKIDKYDINWNLYNGRLDSNLLDDPITLSMGGELVNLDQNDIVHFNFTSQIARAMHGEQKARPLRPVAKDMSPSGMTMRKQRTRDMTVEYINANIMAPMRESIYQQYMEQNGIKDVRQLDPEMQKQLQADVERRVQAKTPERIIDFLSNQFSTTTQRGTQQMLDFLIEYLDIGWNQSELFKSGIVTGEEIVYVGERNQDVVWDILNAKYFTWLGSQHTTRYEKGDWGKYEQWFSVDAMLQRHAMTLSAKDIKQIEKFIEPLGGFRSGGNKGGFDPVSWEVMNWATDSRNPHKEDLEKMNIGRKADHDSLLGLYANVIGKWGSTYGTSLSNYGIRETLIAWRDKRKFRHVTRRNEKTGEPEYYWLDEHYVQKPKDVEVKDVWLDEVWEGTKIGTFDDCIYTGIKPVTSQYKSIFDPFNIDLPFYGMAFNTHMNNSKNISPIDLGKPFQKEIDATMANIRFDMATDIGKVMMMDLSVKPENWTWQEFLDSIKTAKIAPINTNQSGVPVDANSVKSQDMSRMGDMVGKLNYLNVLRQNHVQAMLFNDARIGNISEYATEQNTTVNRNASYNQTEDFFDSHDKVLERSLNALVNKAKEVYRDKPHMHELIFDDVTLAEIKANDSFWWESEGIKISMSTDDISNVDRIKNLALTLSQNNMTPQSVIELSLAKTPSDVMDIMRKEGQKLQQAQQAAAEAQQAQAQAEREAEIEDRDAKFAHEIMLQDRGDISKEHRSLLEASQLERQADVNNNQIADSIERAKIADEREREKMMLEDEREREKIKLKEKEIELKNNNNNS